MSSPAGIEDDPTTGGAEHPSADVPVRLHWVDWARGIAYVLMITAHVAPSDGPLRILLVSEFLAAPLYALLIGCGSQLGREGDRFFARGLVRAVLVLLLGLLLARSEASVVIVLMHLAALMVLCLPLVRLGTRALAVVTAAAALLAVAVPMLFSALAPVPGSAPPSVAEADGGADADTASAIAVLRAVLGTVGGHGPYRLTGLLLCALVGMLAVRALRNADPRAWLRGAAATVLAAALFVGLVIAPNLLGLYEVHAYDGTPSEQLGVAVGALAVLLAMWTLEASPLGRALPDRVAALLAMPGQAALSLYALQILILHVFQVLHPGQRDDSWGMLALLVGVGAVAPLLWRLAVAPLTARRSGLRALRRGPLEALIEGAQHLASRPDA